MPEKTQATPLSVAPKTESPHGLLSDKSHKTRSDLRSHCAIVQPRLYEIVQPRLCDCAMATQVTLKAALRLSWS
jgi:hypothetical protein